NLSLLFVGWVYNRKRIGISCLLIMGWYWRKREKRCLAAAAICGIVFLSSSAWILFAAFIILLLWTAINWILDIIAVKSNSKP
ncbi:MAG: hypothetical protein KOO69_00275, partial [Victivallales bacterium]|nr:hypothetical protein [Victivallales bacterium]